MEAIATRSKKLLVAPGLRNKKLRVAPGLRNKKLLGSACESPKTLRSEQSNASTKEMRTPKGVKLLSSSFLEKCHTGGKAQQLGFIGSHWEGLDSCRCAAILGSATRSAPISFVIGPSVRLLRMKLPVCCQTESSF